MVGVYSGEFGGRTFANCNRTWQRSSRGRFRSKTAAEDRFRGTGLSPFAVRRPTIPARVKPRAVAGGSPVAALLERESDEGVCSQLREVRLNNASECTFVVEGFRPPTAPTSQPQKSAGLDSMMWWGKISDGSLRKAFLYIEQHGSIRETDLIALMGSARAARRFSIELERHRDLLPFEVRIESTDAGKCYLKGPGK